MSDKRNSKLLNKAESLIELRGFEEKSLNQDDKTTDITVSRPSKDKTVLVRIISKTDLKSDGIGVDQARNAVQTLKEEDVDKVILFGKRFTEAARKVLGKHDIEFFTSESKITLNFNLEELYSKTQEYIDELCQLKCGKIPKSKNECIGYSRDPTTCSSCNGTGISPKTNSYRKLKCSVCGGTGLEKHHYSCRIRLISDNADFHFEHGWRNLLRNDLLSLLKILQTAITEHKEAAPELNT